MIRTTLLSLALAAATSLSLAACSDGSDVAEASRAITMPELVNPNTADAVTLLAVEGIDDEMLAELMTVRPFADGVAFADFLSETRDDATREVILGQAFVPLDLNTTAEADFEIIPGVGPKMAHEFEEYRPYTDMAQFEREIGKYVDAEELARLRRYVVIN